jgi:hypothetical protein
VDVVGLRRRGGIGFDPATGKVQDYVHNPQFMVKFALVGVNMAAFHAGAYRDVTHWDKTLPTPAGARVADMPPWPCGSP